MAADHGASAAQGTGEVVSDDRPCITCGYNLRMLPLAGQCPECGTPVAATPVTANLLAAPRSHLQWLRVGAVLMLIATAMFGTAVLALAGVVLAGPPRLPAILLIGVAGALGAAGVACVTGLVILTRRDPRVARDAFGTNLRLALRVTVGAFLLLALVGPFSVSTSVALFPCAAGAVLIVMFLLLPFMVVNLAACLLSQLGLPQAARRVELLYPGQPLLLLALMMTTAMAGQDSALTLLPCGVLVFWAAVWYWAFSQLRSALGNVLRGAAQ